MRVIKFRAWDKENNQMIPDYDNWIDFYGNYWCTPEETSNTSSQEIYNPVKQPILMQFTGLHAGDKGLYEGDIVRKTTKLGEIIGEIRYEPQGAEYVIFFKRFNGSRDVECYDRIVDRVGMVGTEDGFFLQGVEIIGNIYENPELLK